MRYRMAIVVVATMVFVVVCIVMLGWLYEGPRRFMVRIARKLRGNQ